MKKALVVILSFILLFQSLNFKITDVLMISNLVEHIKDHFKKGDSVAEFIALHYGNKYGSHKDKDKEHQKLPFHSDTNSLYKINFLDFSDKTTNISTEYPSESKHFIYVETFQNLLEHSIFQPPKIA